MGASATVAVNAASQMLGHVLHGHASGAGPIKSHTLGMTPEAICIPNHPESSRHDSGHDMYSICLYLPGLSLHMACPKFCDSIPRDSTLGDATFIAIHPCAPDTRKSAGKTKLQAQYAAQSGNSGHVDTCILQVPDMFIGNHPLQ